MPASDLPDEGDTVAYRRTFTNEEVERFAELSKDEGYHHLVADEDGQVVLHGLLTATMPTKLGGEFNYLARTMTFDFPRPAYTGIEITCETTIERIEERNDRLELDATFICEAENGDVVLRGQTEGVVLP